MWAPIKYMRRPEEDSNGPLINSFCADGNDAITLLQGVIGAANFVEEGHDRHLERKVLDWMSYADSFNAPLFFIQVKIEYALPTVEITTSAMMNA